MTHNIRIFLASCIASILVLFGVNLFSGNLQQFFFAQELTKNPNILAAQVSQQELTEKLLLAKPLRNQDSTFPELEAAAALSLLVRENMSTKVLFQKEEHTRLPIASLTKLMSAMVASKYYAQDDTITISKNAAGQEGLGNLAPGNVFATKALLQSLLIESSNDAATALAEATGQQAFVTIMNEEARTLGLRNTRFVNPTGLDPDSPDTAINYSTAEDLGVLTRHMVATYPQLFDILATKERDLFDAAGNFHHRMYNTNELLSYKEWGIHVLGGKTGWTPEAKGCLLLVVQSPNNQGYIITVVLGSPDRFGEMKTLTDSIVKAYNW